MLWIPKWSHFILFNALLWIAKVKACEMDKQDICKSVPYVTREEWRARPARKTAPMTLPVNHVMIIHTVMGACKTTPQCIRNVQFIQDYHLDDKGWFDIAYNFLIGGDGMVYIGKGWQNIGEHTINYNTISEGIAFMGNFTLLQPSSKMINAAKKLIKCGIQEGHLTPLCEIHGHRDATCTDSPGDNLYAIIKQWNNFIGGKLPLYYCKNNNTNQSLKNRILYQGL